MGESNSVFIKAFEKSYPRKCAQGSLLASEEWETREADLNQTHDLQQSPGYISQTPADL